MNSISRLVFALLPGLAAPLNASVAPFTLQSFTVDGGGGRGTGGTYSLVSAIGQPDASSELAAAPYAVTGGFLAISGPIVPPAEPRLQVQPWMGGTLRISWPIAANNFVLEQAPSLPTTTGAGGAAGGLWSQVEESPQTSPSEIFVIVPGGTGKSFYRLRRP